MQAAQQNRVRNTDFLHNTNTAHEEGGGGFNNGDAGGFSNGGAGSGESEDRGGGIGAWFRGIGGGGDQQDGKTSGSPQPANDGNSGGWGWGGGGVPGKGGGWWGKGDAGDAAAAGAARVVAGSPVEVQVLALKEMGFAEVRGSGMRKGCPKTSVRVEAFVGAVLTLVLPTSLLLLLRCCWVSGCACYSRSLVWHPFELNRCFGRCWEPLRYRCSESVPWVQINSERTPRCINAYSIRILCLDV